MVDVISIPTSALLLPELEQVSKSLCVSVCNGVIIFSCLTVGHCHPDIVLMGTIEQSAIY